MNCDVPGQGQNLMKKVTEGYEYRYWNEET